MTYEQASARGLAFAREDGGTLTYKQGVTQHFTAALTTAITAARNRDKLLREYLDFRRGAIALGQKGTREYVLAPGKDPSRAARLARLLTAQGIQVKRAEEAFQAGTQQMPAGTFIVPLAQPAGRLAVTCSIPTSRWTTRSFRNRTVAARRACPIRSTTSRRGACR